MITRRSLLRFTAFGIGTAVGGFDQIALAAKAQPLIDPVLAACQRLAPFGWRNLLLAVTQGEFDIAVPDLRSACLRRLTRIDRTIPGFGDFALAGAQGIMPGNPDLSLLYHAFASAGVVADREGATLGSFPTPAEIEAVENFVYGVEPPNLSEIQARAPGRTLGIAVFALHYRTAPMSVNGRHAELCFARSGISRLGSIEPFYDGQGRRFTVVDEARPFDFRVVPCRFAAFIAAQMPGSAGGFGPQDRLAVDDSLDFWVPLHKLFAGPECIAGLNLDLELSCNLRNDEIAKYHEFLDLHGLQNNWRGEDLENFPFVIKDEMIGGLSRQPNFGNGMLVPRPAPLTSESSYEGKPLTFPVDAAFTKLPEALIYSSLQVLPIPDDTDEPPAYVLDAHQDTQRPAPEYLNIRHRLLDDGTIENLNDRPDMMDVIRAGGYDTLHYNDFSGDGWIAAHCPQLNQAIPARLPAYCMVGLPDFFPNVTQRGLMVWWETKVPLPVRDALWAIPPYVLSRTRIAADVTLPAPFSLEDVTITAIVSQPGAGKGPVQFANGPIGDWKVGLPDGSPGLFDPGWDTSQSIYFSDPAAPLHKFLSGYGLGSPFVEDAKLCAALGNYWPGAAPDGTRVFQPGKVLGAQPYPYPSITPLTDEEIGSQPLTDGRLLPWDGVRGPKLRQIGNRTVAAYTDILRVDYIDLPGTMTAALTARIDAEEYKARTLAMQAMYWATGIHDPDFAHYGDKATAKILLAKSAWAVLSFKQVRIGDPDLGVAEQHTQVRLDGAKIYFFHIFKWGDERRDPDDMRTVLVEVGEQVTAFVSGSTVLIKREGGNWTADRSIPA